MIKSFYAPGHKDNQSRYSVSSAQPCKWEIENIQEGKGLLGIRVKRVSDPFNYPGSMTKITVVN